MRLLIPVVFLLLFMGCEENESDSSINHGHNHNAVIVSLQDSDNVAIVSSENLEFEEQISIDLNTTDCSEISNQMECEMAGCMWHIMDNGMTHCMSMDMGGGNNAPHDIAVDNTNGYWFTTTMMGGEVAMYCAKTNAFLSNAAAACAKPPSHPR